MKAQAMWKLAVAALLATSLAPGNTAAAEEGRLLFVGDVLLAREVAREMTLRGASPWSELKGLGQAEFAMANLEGVVGEGGGCEAQPGGGPCFEARPETLRHAAEAGFTALGLANNHVGDLGLTGLRRTRSALAGANLDALTFEESPGFVRIGKRVVAVIAINLVRGRDGAADAAPSLEAERKLRLARAFADWTVVFVHWGAELKDWPQPAQRSVAEWFVDNGADVIIGHHPHVVIAPECLRGRPVFYSLGNHVFDQKYPETKRGMITDCRIRDGALACGALATTTTPGSSFPHLAEGSAGGTIADCAAPARAGLVVSQWRLRPWGEPNRLLTGPMVIEGRPADGSADRPTPWKMAGRQVLSAELGKLAPDRPPLLLTVERHASTIDSEDGPRPYVYEVTDHGLLARWRGSALAWPLIDARIMDGAEGALLCALHRADTFIRLTPASTGRRTAVYRWAGFGFRAAEDAAAATRCGRMYGLYDGAGASPRGQ
jgi:hypothetical protein